MRCAVPTLLLGLAASLAMSTLAAAPRIETIGPTWPIVEQDFVAWMKARMQQMLTPERIQALQQAQEKRIRDWMDDPPPVAGITRAQKDAMRWYDPTITVPQDVVDDAGRIVLRAGTRFNPLSRHSLSRDILFIDARDPDQVAWVRARMGDRPHVILVGGSPVRLAKTLGQHVWYDQKGRLVHRLGIRHVPAVVDQAEGLLRIREVALR